MKNKKLREQVKSYIIVTLACVLYALSFDWFYAPNGFTVGGFTEMAEKRKACAKKISGELEQAFRFMKECFGDGQETVLFVTGLTRNSHAAAFIREYGCDPYFACSEKLLYRKQEKKLQEECASLLEI